MRFPTFKPILGLEAYFTPDRLDKRSKKDRTPDDQIYNHLIILAKNETGLANLSYLSEKAWEDGFLVKPRMDFELLEERHNGLVVLSGCMNGIIAKAIENNNLGMAKQHALWFKDLFGDDFYIEIQPHNPVELNKFLLELADEVGIKPVVTGDCHFSTKEERALEEAMLILSTSPKSDKDADFDMSRQMMNMMDRFDYLYPDRRISFKEFNLFIQTKEEIESDFKKSGITRTDIFDNTLEIADKISEYDFYRGLDLLPVPKTNADEKLAEMAFKALEDLHLTSSWLGNDEYEIRLYEELDIIKEKSFASYTSQSKHAWTKGDKNECAKLVWNTLKFNGGQFDPRNRDIIDPEPHFDIPIEEDWAKFTYEIDGKTVNGQLAIKGTIDLVTKVSDDTIEVVDWKTGRRLDWATGEEKDAVKLSKDAQLLLYNYAISKLYPQYKQAIMTIYFIKDGGPFSLCFDKSDQEKFLKMLKNRFEQIRVNNTPKPIDPSRSNWKCFKLCHFCRNNWPGSDENMCIYIEEYLKKNGMEKTIQDCTRKGFNIGYYSAPG